MEENDAESREICPKYINPVIAPYRKEFCCLCFFAQFSPTSSPSQSVCARPADREK